MKTSLLRLTDTELLRLADAAPTLGDLLGELAKRLERRLDADARLAPIHAHMDLYEQSTSDLVAMLSVLQRHGLADAKTLERRLSET